MALLKGCYFLIIFVFLVFGTLVIKAAKALKGILFD